MPGIFEEFLVLKLNEQDKDFRSFLKDRFPEEKMDFVISSIKQYISQIPASLRIFSSIVLDPATPSDIRAYFALVSAYMINPNNMVPEVKHSMLGFIDDAYLLHSSLEIVFNNLDENNKAKYEENIKALEPVFKLNPIVRKHMNQDVLDRLDIIINYLEKIVEVKSMAKDLPVYILPPHKEPE